MLAVGIRIGLRYLAGILVGRGILSQDVSDLLSYDPDIDGLIEAGVGVAAGLAAEGWYRLARKFGWAT